MFLGMKKALCFCSGMVLLFGMSVQAADPSADTSVKVPVSVSCEGYEGTDGFSVGLYPKGSKQAEASVLVKAGGSDVLGLSVSKAGEYAYEVRQERGSASGVTYDDSVYDVNVYAEDSDQGLLVQTTVMKQGSGTKTDVASFANTYAGGQESSGLVEVTEDQVPTANLDVTNPNARTMDTEGGVMPISETEGSGLKDGLSPKTGLSNQAPYFASGAVLLGVLGGLFYRMSGRKQKGK